MPKFSGTKGYISKKSKTRLFNSFDWLQYIARPKKVLNHYTGNTFEFRLSFITLTLSSKQKHKDNFVKSKMLSPYLEALRKRYPGISYIWKAETQDNGNIHFHITCDHFIPLSYVQSLWNRYQRKYGYLDEYVNKYKHFNAPSTEIKAVKNDNQVKSYFIKYMAKSYTDKDIKDLEREILHLESTLKKVNNKDELQKLEKKLYVKNKRLSEAKRRKVEGAIWDCSTNLKGKVFRLSEFDLPSYAYELINKLPLIFKNEYISILRIDKIKRFMYQLGNNIYRAFIELLNTVDLSPPLSNMIFRTDRNYRYTI
jgi:hypothetical protein